MSFEMLNSDQYTLHLFRIRHFGTFVNKWLQNHYSAGLGSSTFGSTYKYKYFSLSNSITYIYDSILDKLLFGKNV